MAALTRPGWLVAILMLFVGCTLLCGISEGMYLYNDVPTTLHTLIKLNILSKTWWGSFATVLWFNYSFLQGDWVIFKYCIFWPISAATVVSYVALIFPQLLAAGSTLLSGAAGFVTSIVRIATGR